MNKTIHYIGLDVHKNSIAVAIAHGGFKKERGPLSPRVSPTRPEGMRGLGGPRSFCAVLESTMDFSFPHFSFVWAISVY